MNDNIIKLNKIKLKGIGSYKTDTSIDLSKPSIYIIRGKNLDIKNKKEHTNNGAGKSLLFSTIPQLLYDSYNVNNKSKSMVSNKNSYIKLYIEKNKNSYIIKQEGTGKSFNINILKNKKDISTKNKKDNKNLVNDIVKINQKEYSSFIHITPNNPFVLLNGSNIDRYNFINEIFNLDNFEELKQKFTKKLKELNIYSAKYETNIEEYDRIKKDYKELKEKLKKLKNKKLNNYSDKIEELNNKNQKFLLYESNKKQEYNLKKNIDIDLKDINKAYPKCNLSNIDSFIETINDRIVEIHTIIKDYNSYKDNVNKLNSFKDKKSELKKELKQLKKEIRKIKLKTDKEDIENKMNTYKVEYEQFVKLINTKGICPICKSKIDIKKAKKDKEETKEKYLKLKKELKKHKEYDNIKNNIIFIKNKIENIDENISNIKVKDVKTLDINDLKKEYNDLKNKMLAKLHSVKGTFKSLQILKDNMPDKVEFTKKDNKLLQEYKHKQEEYNKYIIEKEQLKSNIKILKKSLKDNDKRKEYNNIQDDIIVYKSLVKAYSNKGIKTQAVRSIITLYENLMNKYAKIIYSENFKFKIEIKDNNISILCSTKNDYYDVRTLSGAESRFFILCSILSLMSMLKQKTDFIILDESDSNMDSTNSKFYYEKFLPALNKIIPKIICITTKDYEPSYSHKEIIVTKHKGNSSLLEIQH